MPKSDSAPGGGSGGGLGSGLCVFMLRSDSSPAAGGGSGGGLVRGKGQGSGGDSQGTDGAEVLGLVRGISGSADLLKEEAVPIV